MKLLSSWLRSLKDKSPTRASRASAPGRSRRGGYSPRLEILEDRRLPSTVTWINPAGGDWDTASNWSAANLPGPADDVVISMTGITVTHNQGNSDVVRTLTSSAALSIGGGTVSLSTTSSLNSTLTISGPFANLLTTGNLTIAGLFTWAGGTLGGTGQTTATGGIDIAGNTFGENLTSNILNSPGQTIWNGPGNLSLSNGAVFNNEAGSSFVIQTDQTVNGGTFNNSGAVTKNTTTGTTTFTGQLNNNGAVNILTGTFALQGGGAHTGSFTIAAGAGLSFTGNHSRLASGSLVTGSGAVTFSGDADLAGTYNLSGTTSGTTITGGSVNFTGSLTGIGNVLDVNGGNAFFAPDFSVATFDVSNGTLGGPANITVTGALGWSGGTIGGTGSLNLGSGTALTISGNSVTLDNGVLNNGGSATWSGSGAFSLNDGAIFNNQSGATFTIANDQAINSGGVIGTFNNAGTLSKNASTSTTSINSVFNNSGGVSLAGTSTLAVDNGGVDAGAFTVPTGTTLKFAGGTTLLSSTSRVKGGGVVEFNGGNTTDVLGIYDLTGAGSATQVTNGTVNFAGARLAPGMNLTVSGGTANLSPSFTVNALTLSGGVLTGHDTITVAKKFTWSGGQLTGTGTVIVKAAAKLAINGSNVTLDGRTLENAGQATWTGSGGISLNNMADINNMTGATFTIETDQNITSGGVTGTFNNSGTVTKNTTTGTTNVYSQFNNSGTLAVSSGTLDLQNGGSSSGSFTVAGGAALGFTAGHFGLNSGSSIGGSGLVAFNASATVGGGYNLTGGSSATLVTGGAVNFTGSVTSIGSSLAVTGGTAFFDQDFSVATLTISAGTLTGPDNIMVTAALNWNGGAISGSGSLTVGSSGTLAITGTGGETLDNRTLNNAGHGTWSGASNLAFTNAAVFTNEAGATFTISNSQAINTGGAPGVFVNAGALMINSGNTTTINCGFQNSGSVAISTGSLVLNNVAGGVGSFTVAGGATLNLNGGTAVWGAASRFSGAGSLTFGGGTTTLQGTFDITGAVSVSGANTAVAFLASATTGPFTNAGMVTIGTGTVFTVASGSYTQTGGATALQGATLSLGAGQAVNVQSGTFSGSGTINGNFTNGGQLYVGGNGTTGTLQISGNFTQTATGTASFDLAGPTQFDQLNVTGAATLAGTLDVNAVNGYEPAVGASFQIMSYGSHSGDFGTDNFNGNGRTLTDNLGSNAFTITAS